MKKRAVPEKAPAYQWYPKDWKSDSRVQRMTYEQRGIYRELMDTQWLEGSVSSKPAELAQLLGIPLARFEKQWPLIKECFTVREDSRLLQMRLERQRRELKAFHKTKSESGRQGGKVSAIRRKRLAAARKIARHSPNEWLEMVRFFKNRCVKCWRDELPVEADHIVPLYQGGHDGISNIQPLCAKCNAAKGPDSTDYRVQRDWPLPEKWLQQNEAVLHGASQP